MIQLKENIIIIGSKIVIIILLVIGLITTGNTFFIFLIPPVVFCAAIIHYYIKRKFKVTKYIINDFRDIGFEIIDERHMKFYEYDNGFNIEISPLINGIPVSRFNFIRQFQRVFKVKNNEGQYLEVFTIITHQWDRKNKIKICKKRRLSKNNAD